MDLMDLLGELDTGSTLDFEAKKLCWPTCGTAKMAVAVPVLWCERCLELSYINLLVRTF